MAALANVYESTKNYTRAIEVYEQIAPGTPLESAIDIRKAFDLNSLERVEEAKALLAAAQPGHAKATWRRVRGAWP